MPNRLLREGILDSDRMTALTRDGGWAAEAFYRRLLSVVDDFGRFDARLSVVRAKCYPTLLDMTREADLQRWIAACVKAGLVRLYSVKSINYGEVLDFRQQTRAKRSKHPGPPDGDKKSHSRCAADAQQMHSTCVAHAPGDGDGDEKREAEARGENPPNPPPGGTDVVPEPEPSAPAQPVAGGPASPPAASDPQPRPTAARAGSDAANRQRRPSGGDATGADLPGFDRFWAEYPSGGRKANRDGCRAKWRSLGLEAAAGDVLAGLERWKRSAEWAKQGGAFIKGPLPWLNDRRWEADPAPAEGSPDVDGYSALGLAPSREPTAAESELIAEAGRASGGSGDLL